MTNFKRLCAVLLAAAYMLTATACGDNDTASTDDSVYFLNFKPEIADIYNEIAKEYKAETGIDVKVVTAASGTYEQTLKSEVAKSNAPTIFQVNGPVGFKTWKNYCADLTDTTLYKSLTDKDLAITDDGKAYAVPYAVEGYGIIYNDAIMKKYFALPDKKVTINSAEEINSFQQLKEVVEDMQAKKEVLGIDGVFASTSLGAGDQWRWQTHLANIPFYHELKESSLFEKFENTISAGLESKEVEFKYAEKYKNIFDLYVENSVTDKKLLGSKTTADSMAEFALGRCAMVQNGDWAWSQISEVSGNTVKEDDIKFLPIYMGFEGEENQGICIGTENYFAVNSKVSDAKQKSAIDFLEWLFTSEKGKTFVVEKLGFNAPFYTFDENQKPKSPLSKEVVRWLESGKDNIEWTFQAFPNEDFKNDFGDALLQYVQGNMEWENLVTTVKESWKTQFNK